MDDSYPELEEELKALRPRRTSARLRAAIERDLAAASPARPLDEAAASAPRSWGWLGWAALGAAAAVLVLGLGGRLVRPDPAPHTAAAPRPSAPPPGAAEPVAAAQYLPVSAASVLYDLRDEGWVTLDDQLPVRQARFRYVDTYTWRNPATNASVRLSVPRDEVRVLPAHYQ